MAGVEKDVMPMWVFLFSLSFSVAVVFSPFACLRGRWWAD